MADNGRLFEKLAGLELLSGFVDAFTSQPAGRRSLETASDMVIEGGAEDFQLLFDGFGLLWSLYSCLGAINYLLSVSHAQVAFELNAPHMPSLACIQAWETLLLRKLRRNGVGPM